MLELLFAGGIMMIPLALASIIGVASVIIALVTLRDKNVYPDDLIAALASPNQLASRLRVTDIRPLTVVLHAVTTSERLPWTEAQSEIEAAGRRAAHTLSRPVQILDAVATLSPLLGLLGTVLGMYTMFTGMGQSQAAAGDTMSTALSSGIAEALITTITGLFIAIPASAASSMASRRVDAVVLNYEALALELRRALVIDTEGGAEGKNPPEPKTQTKPQPTPTESV